MSEDQPMKNETSKRLPWWLPVLVMALAMSSFIIPAWTQYTIAHRWMEMENHG